MRQAAYLLAAALMLPAWTLAQGSSPALRADPEPQGQGVAVMMADELRAILASEQAPQVVDVREPIEFSAGHVPGAVNIPHTQIGQRLDELTDPDGTLVYCIGGSRTEKALKTLQEHGVEKLFRLSGGLSAWIQDGLPVEKSPPPKKTW